MKKIILVSFLIICLSPLLHAQKVGLVLSGGGAKGLTHIGIIKALEEYNIPIDYIAGTSMGAIVGGLYAMGYTADEMIEIIKSQDFKHWSTGEIESKYLFYYRNADPKPNFVSLPFRVNRIDSLDIEGNILPTNLISPRQMNFAFVPLFAQANALAGGDFDKLFVPFRCVASDVYNKEAVVFRQGILGDAIRASMTFPFVFKPIMIDNRLLFDGGIFNNFPVDVMRTDFKPDYMLGSVVANNPKKPDEKDIVNQIENMIMSRTDYSIPKKDGLLLRFELDNVNTFDFSRVDELVKMGYDSVVAHLDEIKARVPRQSFADEVAEKRFSFRRRFPDLKFQHIQVEGVDSLQKKYVQRVFHRRNDVFDLDEFKEGYFKLISDNKISEVIPHANYNDKTGFFDLNLNVETQDQLQVLIGGNVSSSTSNEAYFGLTYQNLTEYAQTAYFDAQFGKMYNGLGLGMRYDIPTQANMYMKLAFVAHKFDYFEGNRLFYQDVRTSNFTQHEAYCKVSVGFPLTMKGRTEFGLGIGALTDYYLQDRAQLATATDNDRSTYLLGSFFGRIEAYTLNNVMYPTLGFDHASSIQLQGGKETFRSASNSELDDLGKLDLWLQYRGKFDQYYPITPRFTLGAFGELAITTRKPLQNYTATIIQAPSFRPTPHSRTIFNESYSANQFAAIGIKPIYNLSDQLHLRGEAYWFIPYKSIIRAEDNTAAYSNPFVTSHFMAETSLVFNFKLASAGMFLNYYSSAASHWNFGLNIGFLLFNSKFIE